jgi:uncharacterized protein (DUF433 family)
MADSSCRLIGTGIYTIPEAARLTQIEPGRIRRWLRGYHYRSAGQLRESRAVVPPELPVLDGALALSFLDLQEVRFVDAFLKRGVSWKTLRITSERARELLQQSHPFSSGRFVTDGRNILLETATSGRDSAFLNMVRNQLEFRRIVQQFLARLDFAEDQAVRWWPMGKRKPIVIDPLRSFGQPIVSNEGVPTAVLARAVRVERSIDVVARWFEVSKRSVQHAAEFESSLAAA